MAHTYQFYAKMAWIADAFLLAASLVLSLTVILYMIIQDYRWRARNRSLLDIKRRVYELVLSGEKGAGEELARIADKSTPQQFLDITTNRNRELIFFGESEQSLFKKYFLSEGKIKTLKKTARGAFNKWRRIEAIIALGQAGLEDVVGVIGKSLFDRDDDISYFSMISLGQVKTPASAKALLKFLKKNPGSGPKVVSILESFPAAVADDAAELLTDRDPAVRIWALKLIAKFGKGAEARVEAVRRLTEDKLAEVRAASCECLGRIGRHADKAILTECLKDDSWLVRANSIKALAELLGKEAIPIIIDRMNDPSLSVIEILKDALVEHIDAAMPYLEKVIGGEDVMMNRISVEVLEESGRLAGLLKDAVSGAGDEKTKAVRFLRGMIKSGTYPGLEWTIVNFEPGLRDKVLAAIKDIDASAAEHIENRIAGGSGGIPGV